MNQVFGSPQEAEQSHMPLHLLHGLVKRLTFGSHRINQTALGALIGWQSFSCPIHWRCTYSRGDGGDSYVSSYILRTFHLIYVSVSTTPHPFFTCLLHLRWSCIKKEREQVIRASFFLACDFSSVLSTCGDVGGLLCTAHRSGAVKEVMVHSASWEKRVSERDDLSSTRRLLSDSHLHPLRGHTLVCGGRIEDKQTDPFH